MRILVEEDCTACRSGVAAVARIVYGVPQKMLTDTCATCRGTKIVQKAITIRELAALLDVETEYSTHNRPPIHRIVESRRGGR